MTEWPPVHPTCAGRLIPTAQGSAHAAGVAIFACRFALRLRSAPRDAEDAISARLGAACLLLAA